MKCQREMRTRFMSPTERIGWYMGPREPNGCRLWTGQLSRNGNYAIITVSGTTQKASRLILGLPVGDRRKALHSCDNPRCVEPTHLRAGTPADNAADMMARGRHAKWRPSPGACSGERNNAAKLTAATVATIRQRHKTEGLTHLQLAAEYGISRRHVGALVSSDNLWKGANA